MDFAPYLISTSNDKEEADLALAINNLNAVALELNVKGTVDESDYKQFVPLAEARIEKRGHLNLLVDISEVSGFRPAALWEDLKFDVKHYSDVSRLAIVGKDESRAWLATIAKPFTGADVEFYPKSELDAARRWVSRDSGSRSGAL